jgi:hypothetical protein
MKFPLDLISYVVSHYKMTPSQVLIRHFKPLRPSWECSARGLCLALLSDVCPSYCWKRPFLIHVTVFTWAMCIPATLGKRVKSATVNFLIFFNDMDMGVLGHILGQQWPPLDKPGSSRPKSYSLYMNLDPGIKMESLFPIQML